MANDFMVGNKKTSADAYIDSLFPELKGEQVIAEKPTLKIDKKEPIISPKKSKADAYIDTMFPELEGSIPGQIDLTPGAQKTPEQEGIIGKAIRGVARTGARVAETALGLPSDIMSFIGGLAKTGLEKATGTKFPTQEEFQKLVGKEKPRGLLGIFPEELPTSDKIRKDIAKVAPEGYLEPKTETEARIDEFVQDATSLLIPLGGRVPWKKALKVAGAGNIAGWLTKKVAPGAEAPVKMGTMLLTSFGNPLSFKKFVKELYPNQATRFMREATEASKIMNWSRRQMLKIGEKIGTKVGGVKIDLNPLTGILLGGLLGKGKLAALAVGGMYAAGYTERLVRMLSRSPELRGYYMKTLASAAKENAPAFARNARKLNAAISKQQSSF